MRIPTAILATVRRLAHNYWQFRPSFKVLPHTYSMYSIAAMTCSLVLLPTKHGQRRTRRGKLFRGWSFEADETVHKHKPSKSLLRDEPEATVAKHLVSFNGNDDNQWPLCDKATTKSIEADGTRRCLSTARKGWLGWTVHCQS
jgi:hypothetical protein